MFDAKTCSTCEGEGVMYELPGEPFCEECGGCGEVGLDGSRLEVLSHGAPSSKTTKSAFEQSQAQEATEAGFLPGGWVVRRDWQQLAKIKDVNPAWGSLGATLDLVIYSRSGERVGRETPAMGGPRGFEPCCDAVEWAPIRQPAFALPKYERLFRVVKFINPADAPEDNGRL